MNPPTTTSPRIFLLEPDDNARPVMKHNLQAWGYQIVIALNEEDAIQRTQGTRDRFDLILINQVGKTVDDWIAIGQQIRQNTVLDSRAPIIIIAESYEEDIEGQDIQVGNNEFVTYLEDGQQLKNILQRLCPIN